MRLQTGESAPDFTVKDIFGNLIRLRDFAGKTVLLSFYRYASCPFCNLRVRELILQKERFEELGLHLVAFFQSPKESIAYYVGRQDPPFPVVADPEHRIYKLYRVQSSLLGALRGMMNLPKFFRAMASGFLPGKMEGDKTLLPADFLIGPDGRILRAYYGKDISDHLPLEEIESSLQPTTAAG